MKDISDIPQSHLYHCYKTQFFSSSIRVIITHHIGYCIVTVTTLVRWGILYSINFQHSFGCVSLYWLLMMEKSPLFPGVIDATFVLNQLNCNGVLDGLRVARTIYPSKMAYAEFRKRYVLLTWVRLITFYMYFLVVNDSTTEWEGEND